MGVLDSVSTKAGLSSCSKTIFKPVRIGGGFSGWKTSATSSKKAPKINVELAERVEKLADLEVKGVLERRSIENRKTKIKKLKKEKQICEVKITNHNKKKEGHLLIKEKLKTHEIFLKKEVILLKNREKTIENDKCILEVAKKDLEKKVNLLKNRSDFRRFCDRVIIFFSMGLKKSASFRLQKQNVELAKANFQLGVTKVRLEGGAAKLKKVGVDLKEVEAELKTVGDDLVSSEKKLLTVKVKLQEKVERQAYVKAKYFGGKVEGGRMEGGRVSKITDTESDIVESLIEIIKEDGKNASRSLECIRKKWNDEWDAAWKKSRSSDEGVAENGEEFARKNENASDLQRSRFEKMRDARWEVLCDRARRKVEKGKLENLKSDLRVNQMELEIQRRNMGAVDVSRSVVKGCQINSKIAQKQAQTKSDDLLENSKINAMLKRVEKDKSAAIKDVDKKNKAALKKQFAENEEGERAISNGFKRKYKVAKRKMANALVKRKREVKQLEALEGGVNNFAEIVKNLLTEGAELRDRIETKKKVIGNLKTKIYSNREEAMTEMQKLTFSRDGKIPEGFKAEPWSHRCGR